MDGATETQLSIIRELAGALGRAGLRFWLRGGWALDFHAGRITRPHRDVDLVTWGRHRRRLVQLLQAEGYTATARSGDRQLFFQKLGQEVNFVLIYRRGGAIVTPGFEHWPWPDGAFSARLLTLEGTTCRALTVEALLEEKEHYEGYVGAPLRPKDHVSLRTLRALIDGENRGGDQRRDPR